MNVHYLLGFLFSFSFLRTMNRLQVFERQRLPRRGGLIIASNHASHLDSMVVGSATYPLELHFMARSTLFRPFWFAWMLKKVNAHPIERGKGPDQNWGSFIQLIQSGQALLIFPEGTRTLNGELQRGKSGFGRMVHMSQAPVYPAYVDGSFKAWPKGGRYRPSAIRIIFGNAIPMADLLSQPDKKLVLREISDRAMQAIAELKAELNGKTSLP
ncbi:1-acyl-sn-glycerol-3-phosphate acyltransferase [candidate division FCPU426 bacterium]|nr:1-acyl-sn-glycerol-3-phosphate acyltransferase [candidate division FCPU426 bacterium]